MVNMKGPVIFLFFCLSMSAYTNHAETPGVPLKIRMKKQAVNRKTQILMTAENSLKVPEP